MGGYSYCFQGIDGMTVASGTAAPTGQCCQNGDTSCAPLSDTSYSCSSSYRNRNYAITMCPQIEDTCGNKQTMALAAVADTDSVAATGFSQGETCTYRTKTACGAPAVELTAGSLVNDVNVQVTWFTYASQNTVGESISSLSTPLANRTSQAPVLDSPARDERFSNLGGPQTGQYNLTTRGYMIMGQADQGDGSLTEGIMWANTDSCAAREIWWTITSIADTASSATANFNTKSFDFVGQTSMGASSLAIGTAAALVGMTLF